VRQERSTHLSRKFDIVFPFALSSVRNLLPTPLLHLRLPLALRGARLGHTSSVLVARALESSVHAIERIDTVHGNDKHAPPHPVAKEGRQCHASIGPVCHIPHVLSQARRVQVLAGALDGAIRKKRGAREALELQVDQELRRREEEVEEQGAAREGRAEDEGSKQPEQAVESEGKVERGVQTARIGSSQGLGGFLRGVRTWLGRMYMLHGCPAVVCRQNNDHIARKGRRIRTCAMMGRCYFNRRRVSKQNATRHLVGPRAIADDVLLVRCAHRHGGGRWQASRIRACPVRQLSPFQTTSGSTASLTFARRTAPRTLPAPPAAVDALAAS